MMETWIDVETFDIKKFAESLVKDCQEGVKWERRKLEWVLEEEKKRTENQSESEQATTMTPELSVIEL